MKTYEEMAQSVLTRAKAHRTNRNRWLLGTVAAVCALGIGLGAFAMRPDTPTLQSPPVTEAPSVQAPRVTFLHTDGIETNRLEPGVKVPFKSQLRVRDVRGMTLEQIEAVCQEEHQYAEQLIDAYPEAAHDWGTLQFGPGEDQNLVLTYIDVGRFVLKLPDPEQVEEVRITTRTGAVIMCTLPRSDDPFMDEDPFAYPKPLEYILDHETMLEHYSPSRGGIATYCFMSSPLMYYLNDTLTPLSQISDTLTFTVSFRDGTQETYVIDMLFNDNGDIYALYRGPQDAV